MSVDRSVAARRPPHKRAAGRGGACRCRPILDNGHDRVFPTGGAGPPDRSPRDQRLLSIPLGAALGLDSVVCCSCFNFSHFL